MLSSKEIREKWLKYFESKDHLIVETKSLVPINDPSLLWINSGVATLKDYFSGKKIPPKNRLTNSQKSLRTNDIENVGITTRHHTMFEMLGNFSIGDYFKNEAIEYAYDFLLNELKLEKDKLYFTYFEEDEETKRKWMSLGIDESHIIKGTMKTNFWDIGSGPCGPCTEIFFDRGEKFDKRGVELLKNDEENDRFIEIWNLVFSQFNNDGENNYTELAQKNIDTGAGFERLVSIMQNAPTNYDTDLFLPIIKEIEKLTPYKYKTENYFIKDENQEKINIKFKIIADHIRAIVNAINDGVEPSNVSRGYIIRRLIRRSYRAGLQLEIKEKTFLHTLVTIVKNSLPYDINVKKVSKIIKEEELLFSQTIEQGHKLLEKELENKNQEFDFAIAFKLFETYGFPIELTQEILLEKGVKLDISQFEKYKQMHAELSRGLKKVAMKTAINSLAYVKGEISNFIGYNLHEKTAKIVFLANSEKELKITEKDEISYVIFDETVFYATGGGQKHDQGYILQDNRKIQIIEVFKDKFRNNVHVIKGILDKDQPVQLFVDKENRIKLERNHSSTHLLFKSLREQYGMEIKQLGSDNNENRLTFDFPLNKKPTEQEVFEIENRVRNYIKSKTDRYYIETTIKEAEKMNAIMTLEESEYMDPTNVRLVEFKNITVDLCGGTHIKNTHLIENFKIVSTENKGTGIFRIKAITSNELIDKYLDGEIEKETLLLNNLVEKNIKIKKDYQFDLEKTDDKEKQLEIIKNSIEKVRQDYKNIMKEIDNTEIEINVIEEVINNHKYFINFDIPVQNLKNQAVILREKNPNITFILGAKTGSKTLIIVSSKIQDSKMVLDKILNSISGNGGGNKILAQGSINDEKNAIEKIKGIL
ncbi:alanine--tRNA ligase [Mesomycoplasma lagogenitalium]|uniref:Alanine--tRNA ligase n=1 Tax=Mesomycoplasma lagogenitalium TaxID=171286 RepID=A0ABY8LUP9_9BACT|nr:alanine--tRNA ligase [Mesomycoplasma lagogenitalium]WGI36435.1 alanine--tRNA ligase [Mesomycoplasma lagogenitalium]